MFEQENEQLKAQVAKQGEKTQSIADDVRDQIRREMEIERENQPRQPDPRSPVLDDEQIESYRRRMRQMEDDHDRRVRNLRKDLDDERDAKRRLQEDVTDLKSQLTHFRQKEDMMEDKIKRLKQEKTGLEEMIADLKQNKDQAGLFLKCFKKLIFFACNRRNEKCSAEVTSKNRGSRTGNRVAHTAKRNTSAEIA